MTTPAIANTAAAADVSAAPTGRDTWRSITRTVATASTTATVPKTTNAVPATRQNLSRYVRSAAPTISRTRGGPSVAGARPGRRDTTGRRGGVVRTAAPGR